MFIHDVGAVQPGCSLATGLPLSSELRPSWSSPRKELQRKFVAAPRTSWLACCSRVKSNEQVSKGVKGPDEADAQFAVHALGLVIREIGCIHWASEPQAPRR